MPENEPDPLGDGGDPSEKEEGGHEPDNLQTLSGKRTHDVEGAIGLHGFARRALKYEKSPSKSLDGEIIDAESEEGPDDSGQQSKAASNQGGIRGELRMPSVRTTAKAIQILAVLTAIYATLLINSGSELSSTMSMFLPVVGAILIAAMFMDYSMDLVESPERS